MFGDRSAESVLHTLSQSSQTTARDEQMKNQGYELWSSHKINFKEKRRRKFGNL
jgi:hypothetical protein